MKRICIIRQQYFPACVRVRKEALALIDKGFMVDVICIGGQNEKKTETYKGVRVYRLSMQRHRGRMLNYLFEYLWFFCVASTKLCLLYFRNKYDFIQVNTLPDFLVFVALIPKLFGAKVILDLHEPSPELYGTIFGFQKKLLLKTIGCVEQLSISYADEVITVSEEMKLNYIKRGASSSKISVILNVPNLEFNPEFYSEAYQNKSNGNFELICHGAMMKRYGQETAIKAIGLVKEQIINVRLNILGYGDYEKELRKLVSDLKLEDYVHFHGYIQFEDMIKMIATANIGIVPVEKNPYSDLVHTNKMFELIAMRKPVIISRANAVEDFFGSDDSCLKYFESGDEKHLARCIVELYHHPEQREMMVRNAYTKFESVCWEKTKETYCNLFR